MKALLLIDLQVDFAPGGALPVPDGNRVVPLANALMDKFDLVVATQDWHPSNHGSFAVNHPGMCPGQVTKLDGLDQMMWPVHCVQDTPGADFIPGLDTARFTHVSRKGMNPLVDSYSGFFDNAHRQATGLEAWLKERKVHELFVMGLATDYCVKFTAMDAIGLGFVVTVVKDGCRGIDLRAGDIDRAYAELTANGARVVMSQSLLA
jgi:nicotinamidase/pyrazinamidase